MKYDLDKVIKHTKKKLNLDIQSQEETDLKTIMIVDDDENLVKSIEFIFRDKYKIISAYSGKDALVKFYTYKDKIYTIVLDIKMDDKDGIEVCKEIKRIRPAIPVIFNTAFPGEYEPLDLVQTIHPFGYIIKGSDPSILYDNISSAVAYFTLYKEKDNYIGQLQAMVSNLKNLHGASQKLTAILNKEQLYQEISTLFYNISAAEYIYFYILENFQWKVICSNLKDDHRLYRLLLTMGYDLIPKLGDVKKAVFWNKQALNHHCNAVLKSQIKNKITNMMFLPITVQKGQTGVVVLINIKTEKFYFNSDFYLLETLGNQIGIALKNILMIEDKIKDKEVSTIGKMASTIIHDLNNPLTVIKNYIELIKEVGNKEIKSFTYDMMSEYERISYMIEELVVFLRKGSSRLIPVKTNINMLIKNYCMQVKKNYHDKDITFKLNLLFKGTVFLDKHKFIRVVQNITNNAMDAISRKGTISISTRKADNFLEIKISDSGKGMDEDTSKKIFDPFFTKKDKSGIGLGMYIVKQIVLQHNGVIDVKSELNKGTTFIIKLPLKKEGNGNHN